MRIIDSAFDVFAMIGDPVAQTKTPYFFNQFCAERDLNAVMVPMRIAPGQALHDFINVLRETRFLKGLVSTIPHKMEIIHLVDRLGPTAKRLGVVNAVSFDEAGRLVGDMFDGVGLLKAHTRRGFDVFGKRAIIIGGGSSGSAIGFALNSGGAAMVTIVETSEPRRRVLTECLAGLENINVVGASADFTAYDLIINASPLGMKGGDPLPGEIDNFKAGALVADLVTPQSGVTRFLSGAKSHGCEILTGEEIAHGHLEAVLNFFNMLDVQRPIHTGNAKAAASSCL